MKDKIDAVILFVDMNDDEWQEKYNNYIKKNEIPNKHINNKQRFNDYGALRALFRSLGQYAKWINNIFLVVQSYSQVPKWVNKNTVKIILHEDFIPEEYLPTFNCNTIEMHLHLIPGLSEKFIYFNDDTLLNDINYPEDYFIGDKCVCFLKEQPSNRKTNEFSSWYTNLRYSNVKELSKIFGNKLLDYVYYNSHGPTPMFKTLCAEVYNMIDIRKNMSFFREKYNLTQELFTVYALYKRRLIWLKNSFNDNYSTRTSNDQQYMPNHHLECKIKLFSNENKTFCMNDVFLNKLLDDEDLLYAEISELLSKRFDKISKYENSELFVGEK